MTTESMLQEAPPRPSELRWGNALMQLTIGWADDAAARLEAVTLADGIGRRLYRMPLVELLTADAGHRPASARLAHTALGERLRYVHHEVAADDRGTTLTLRQAVDGLVADLVLELPTGTSATRARVIVHNDAAAPLVLRGATSASIGFTAAHPRTDVLADWQLTSGISDWLGEGRWATTPLRGSRFVDLAEELTGHNPRGSLSVSSTGTWSSGYHLPTGLIASSADDLAVAWQIEHNGAWRWELGEDSAGGYLSLSGPTDRDAAWTTVLQPGESFTTVPAVLAFAADGDGAIDALTTFRRATRRPHPDNAAMPVVFNDYMNTLDGDPTTEKLLPLVAAAAEVGAEVFCIDAGWYDDSGHWWDTVGEWTPSMTRFPNGLAEVIDAIRDAGMVAGLWLEPEVIGVRSPLADRLPPEAFLQRHGQRIVEHDRMHLDLRHPAARAHLDAVVDRLVDDFGVGFFKLDYNIDPGPGTDFDADSVGDGLLGHNRAHLGWLDGVLDRHPDLILENCGSGAMRMDYALLSRLSMQSTSDQQDFVRYPPIAAAAPMSILPEQAASWAYPQPSMTPDEAAFCLVTGLLGRIYVSGHLNRMSESQRELVAEAIVTAKRLRGDIATSTPTWPSGLPSWDDEWVSTALSIVGGDTLVSVWRRGESASVDLAFPRLRGVDVDVVTEFPTNHPGWTTRWSAETGVLTVHVDGHGPSARTLRLTPRTP